MPSGGVAALWGGLPGRATYLGRCTVICDGQAGWQAPERQSRCQTLQARTVTAMAWLPRPCIKLHGLARLSGTGSAPLRSRSPIAGDSQDVPQKCEEESCITKHASA